MPCSDPPLRRARTHTTRHTADQTAHQAARQRTRHSRHCAHTKPAAPAAGSLCTGYGGLDMAAHRVLGTRLAWYAENDRHASTVLAERFPAVPNLGDLAAVDWATVPRVDLVTAGFPCQDISWMGLGAGIKKGTRSGLWITIANALRDIRPRHVFLENVAALRSRGLGRVLGDLAALGYDTAWTCLRAADVGAPHRRERLFILATDTTNPRPQDPPRPRPAPPDGPAGQPPRRRHAVAHADGEQLQRRRNPRCLAQTPGTRRIPPLPHPVHRRAPVAWRQYGPAIRRWEHHLGRLAPHPLEVSPRGLVRLHPPFVEWMMGLDEGHVTGVDIPFTATMRALGNGVVPQQAEQALRLLLDQLHTAR